MEYWKQRIQLALPRDIKKCNKLIIVRSLLNWLHSHVANDLCTWYTPYNIIIPRTLPSNTPTCGVEEATCIHPELNLHQEILVSSLACNMQRHENMLGLPVCMMHNSFKYLTKTCSCSYVYRVSSLQLKSQRSTKIKCFTSSQLRESFKSLDVQCLALPLLFFDQRSSHAPFRGMAMAAH